MQSSRGSLNDLGQLLESAPDPVYVVDDEGRIIFLNAACAAWTGIEAAELLGQQCHFREGDGEFSAAAVADALAPSPEVLAGSAVCRIVTCPSPSGELRRRNVQFVPLGRGRDELVGIVALAAAELPNDTPADPVEQRGSEAAALHENTAHFRRLLRRWHDPAALVGESPCMAQVRAQLAAASASDATVLIVGPEGSGRQRIARTLHALRDPEGQSRLAPLACALLEAELLQSTLQAAVRPGHSGAPASVTLLLNQIEELPAEAQGQLMALLRDPPPGLRVVATSAEPLVGPAERGDYRLDLACALSTITIRLERLADRPEDVPLLAQWFVEQANAAGEKQLAGFSPEALDQLVAYEWPGEAAELADVVAEAHRTAEGHHITPADLPRKIALAVDAARHAARRDDGPIELEQFMGEIETELIRRALARAKGNKTKAAQMLGMTRPRLYRRLVQLGLEGG